MAKSPRKNKTEKKEKIAERYQRANTPDKIVLAALGFRNYTEYTLSPHWTRFRHRMFHHRSIVNENNEILCTFCMSPDKPVIHHKTYVRLGDENLNDCVIVCEKCHNLIHKVYKSNHRKGNLWAITDYVGGLIKEGKPVIVQSSKKPKTKPEKVKIKPSRTFEERLRLIKKDDVQTFLKSEQKSVKPINS